MQRADKAMYQQKVKGKNGFRLSEERNGMDKKQDDIFI